MATQWTQQPDDPSDRQEGYRRLRDAIGAVLGPRPSDEDVRALRSYIDSTLAEVEAHTEAPVRALAPDEPGFALRAGQIIAQQESTEEFLAFLGRHSAAAADADAR